MRRFLASISSAALLVLLSFDICQAGLIAQRSGPVQFLLGNEFQAIEFTTTGAYTNVIVEAPITGFDPSGNFEPGSGTVYLMTRIGPGTSVADEVGHVELTNIPVEDTSTVYTLFSGLTLSPDTYYIVVASDFRIGFIDSEGQYIDETAPGVTIGPAHLGSTLAAYAPATPSFTAGDGLHFRVTGDGVTDIPEPTGLGLVAISLALAAGYARRRRRATE